MRGGVNGSPTECKPNCIRSKNEICSDEWDGSMKCLAKPRLSQQQRLNNYWETYKTTPEYNM